MFLDIEEIRDKDNETGMKERRGIEMSNYKCFPYTRCTLSFAVLYLPVSYKPLGNGNIGLPGVFSRLFGSLLGEIGGRWSEARGSGTKSEFESEPKGRSDTFP